MSEAKNPPKTMRQALDELAAMGLEEEVKQVRSRMNDAQTDFLTRLTGRDFAELRSRPRS